MTYYVEPDYWVAGYAVGDSAGGLVFASGLSSTTATILNASNVKIESFVALSNAVGTVKSGGALTQFFPGVNLNIKSSTIAASVYRTKGGAIISAQSDTKSGGRIFWEMTGPASGTWTTIDPQAEGSGQ